MKLETSQDYDVDNRYDFIKQNVASDGEDEGRFIMSGPGDVTYGFRNAFRASLFNR